MADRFHPYSSFTPVPTTCCLHPVLDVEGADVICRAWTENDALAIIEALSGTPRFPALSMHLSMRSNAEPALYAVVDREKGVELCRAWNEDLVRYIADALND